jgi:hypothetical protein
MTKDQIILDWNETSDEALLAANSNPVSVDINNHANKSALETAMGEWFHYVCTMYVSNGHG